MTSVDAALVADNANVQPGTTECEPAAPLTSPGRSRKWSPSWTSIAVGLPLCVAVLAGWFAFYGLVLTAFVEHGTQFRLYGQLRSELAQETAPLGGSIKPGAPIALLSVPALGLRNAVVIEGTTSDQLTRGPGHLRDTPLPGQPGVSIIFGRSATFGAPFAGLEGLKRGATVRVTTGQGTFGYRVDRVRLRGSPPRTGLLPPGASEITLVSSAGSGWRSGWAPNRTVLADATLVKGQLQRAPAGMPSSVSRASQPMQADTPPLIPLTLWLAGLPVLLLPAIWARRRWGRWQLWLAGLPILIAILWGATRSAQLLLPNLI